MTTRIAAYSLSLTLSCGLAACRADAVPDAALSVRDSAGIRLVEYGATPEGAGPFVFASQPLYRYGAGPEDYPGLVTAVAGRFVYMRSDRPEVTWRNPDGTVHRIVRWRSPPAYPDEEDWRLFESSLRAMLRPANPHIQSEAEFEELMQRSLSRYELVEDEPLPLFTQPFGDREGRLWLGHFTVGAQVGGVSGYSILAPDGTALGDVQAPEGVRLLDVAHGRALGAFRDELGVESLVLYELLPPGAAGGN